MYQAKFIKGHDCIFYKDGLCTFHNKGLKLTEGKLSHHILKEDNRVWRKSVPYNVAKTWQDIDNDVILGRLMNKMKQP